jgi:ATP-binding cassette subfamily B protein
MIKAESKSKFSIYTAILILLSQLSARRKAQLLGLAILMTLTSVLQVIFILSVMPFLNILINPTLLLPGYTSFATQLFNLHFLHLHETLLLLITILFIAVAIALGVSRTITAWLSGRMAAAIGDDLSDDAFYRTLLQPYIVHINRNSSEVIAGIAQVNGIISGVLAPCLQLFSSAVIFGGALLSVLLVSWKATFAAVILLGGSYLLIAARLHRPLQRNGQLLMKLAEQELRVMQESLGGIRDMLIDNSQLMHRERYRSLTTITRRITADTGFLQSFPRFAVEAIAYALIGIGCYAMVGRHGTILSSLPLLGVFALAAQTILPNLQQMYSCWSSIRASGASLLRVMDLLSQPIDVSHLPISATNKRQDLFQWHQSIKVSDISFAYNILIAPTLRSISFEIGKGQSIGLVGPTGSGKTTLTDILMGLLAPDRGTLFVDGLAVGGSELPLVCWRSCVAHVPQSLYLADTSIAENIAYGCNKASIDFDHLAKVCNEAQLDGFLASLPDGWHTFVGERGLRLSGGQRQRIGIARALYRSCSFLVLDEATSALDTVTESRVMAAIDQLKSDITMVIVAHRLSTVEQCDRIIFLEQGRCTGFAPYQELLMSHQGFREMALNGDSYE